MLYGLSQVEREKRKAALTAEAQKRAAVGGGWFGGWFGGGAAAADKSKEEGQEASEGELSEEEIDHLRQLVTEQEDALDVGAPVLLCINFGPSHTNILSWRVSTVRRLQHVSGTTAH